MFSKAIPLLLTLGLFAAVNTVASAQARALAPPSHVRSSAAYAELLLRQTELTAGVESLLMEFTEDYPKVKDLRLELDLLKAEGDRLSGVKPADAPKLTLALGKLILGKVGHATSLKRLLSQYQEGHPSVKKEKRMVEIYEAAIKEILG